MSTYTKTIIKVSVHLYDENPVFGESSTHIFLDDEGGGPFIKFEQCNDVTANGTVTFNDVKHMTAVYEAAKELFEKAPA